jgi:hypothetical protein
MVSLYNFVQAEARSVSQADAIYTLHQWLDDDRDRRRAVIRASNIDLWDVSLYIDQHAISGASGYEFSEVLIEALAGMVIEKPPEGHEVEGR